MGARGELDSRHDRRSGQRRGSGQAHPHGTATCSGTLTLTAESTTKKGKKHPGRRRSLPALLARGRHDRDRRDHAQQDSTHAPKRRSRASQRHPDNPQDITSRGHQHLDSTQRYTRVHAYQLRGARQAPALGKHRRLNANRNDGPWDTHPPKSCATHVASESPSALANATASKGSASKAAEPKAAHGPCVRRSSLLLPSTPQCTDRAEHRAKYKCDDHNPNRSAHIYERCESASGESKSDDPQYNRGERQRTHDPFPHGHLLRPV
jgi:hypothetical protein